MTSKCYFRSNSLSKLLFTLNYNSATTDFDFDWISQCTLISFRLIFCTNSLKLKLVCVFNDINQKPIL